MVSLFDRESDQQAVSLLINWRNQLAVHGWIEESDYETLIEVYRSREEAQTMLIKTLERDKRHICVGGRIDRRPVAAASAVGAGGPGHNNLTDT